MTRVVVTGGAGVLGSSVVHELQSRGMLVRVLGRRPAPATLPDRVEWAADRLDCRGGPYGGTCGCGRDCSLRQRLNCTRK